MRTNVCCADWNEDKAQQIKCVLCVYVCSISIKRHSDMYANNMYNKNEAASTAATASVNKQCQAFIMKDELPKS